MDDIYRPKKETSATHLCEFFPNESSFFFFFHLSILLQDYLTMLCAKKKFVRCIFTAMTTPQAPVPKLRKSHNISRVYHLHYPRQHIPFSLEGPVAELL